MWDNLWLTAAAGLAAGLGVAMPLGAIGALLIREGLTNGFRVAAAGAGGVALVDTTYCAVATLVGAAAAEQVDEHRSLVLTVSGLLVIAVGVRQVVQALRRRASVDEPVPAARPAAVFAQFVGLTAVNPITLVYFVALAGSIGVGSGGWGTPVVFVAAVGVASLAWQLALAGVGAILGRGLDARATEVIGLVAAVVVIGLGAGVLIAGIRA